MTDYPENTLRAFHAIAERVDVIEFDVRRCGSGELVVFHDERLERVTAGGGYVAETSWSELKELRIHGTTERIPLLSEVLAGLPNSMRLNIELKSSGIAADVHTQCLETTHDVLISSFDDEELRDAADAGFDSLAPLCYEGYDQALNFATDLDCCCIHPSVELALSTDVITRAHDLGLETNVWTIKTSEQFEKMRTKDVDGVFVNTLTIA
jgi:glycerophosphoryl diester phosphodiesterase